MENLKPGEARGIAEELAEAVRRVRFSWNERIFAVGVSVGLVPISRDSESADAILKAADAACHVAKEGGRNRLHEYQPGDTAIAERSGEMQWISPLQRWQNLSLGEPIQTIEIDRDFYVASFPLSERF